MARAPVDSSSLRFSRRESERVLVALLVSLLAHLVIWAGYHTGHKLGWWQKWRAPAWLHLEPKPHPPQPRLAQTAEPTVFVDVSQADADAPAKPKYYSNRNSHAANPDAATADDPRIDGRQKDVPKTEDVARPAPKSSATPPQKTREAPPADEAARPEQLQPSPRPTAAPPVADTPEPPPTPGETDLLKPKTTARPRTLKQALAQRDQIPGQRLQQAGGVPRYAVKPSLDAKATPFGEYDAALVEAVSQRWYDLLDNHRFAQDRTGKVTLRFKLKPDGSVLEVQSLDNTVGDVLGYLCQEAIEEAAPFAKWPPDMVRMVGANYRDISFTFYYY